jgi:hypothetical protein
MKQVTAVEWLFEQIRKDVIGLEYDYADALEQAKEMERQQQGYSVEDLKEAFEYGIASGIYQVEKGKNGSMDFEQFIEQFKKK